METCKSCLKPIDLSDDYCKHCGGKVIRKRLSLIGTWQEFIGPFFSWDNNFWSTCRHLIIKPDAVLTAYTSGARKRYFHPFSFLLVYASIVLLIYKFFPIDVSGFAEELITKFSDSGIPMNVDSVDQVNEVTQKVYSNYNLLVVLSLPFMALVSYITFIPQKHNFSEHLVFQAYLQSVLGYSALFMQSVFTNLDFGYSAYSNTYLITAILYSNFVFYRMYRYSWKTILLVNLKFIGTFILLSIGLLILTALLSL